MKKIYIVPSLKVKGIKINNLIMASPTVSVSSTEYSGKVYSKESADFEDEEPAKAWGSIW